MVWLFKWIVFGHVHKWQDVRGVELEIRDRKDRPYKTGTRYVTRCEKCGSYRKWDCI